MSMTANLIGLYSPAAGSGKTTLALGLRGHGYVRCRFADPLKAMLSAFLTHQGEHPDMVARMLDGDLKETPAATLAGRTPRHAMRCLGTEWGRDCMAPDIWVNAAMMRAGDEIEAGRRVVFDDMRFENEAAAIKRAGGMLVRITRPGLRRQAGEHASEGALNGWQFDLEITNDAGCPRAFVLDACAAIARAGG